MHVFTRRVENGVDPDQLASQMSADLNLHSFQNIWSEVFKLVDR